MKYSSVVLQSDAGIYILIGLSAFALGTGVALLCLRIKQKVDKRKKR